MKQKLRTEIKNLLSGNKEKQDIIMINTFECEPGTYRYKDKIINEVEKQELEKTCNILVIFVRKKNDA